MWGILRPRSALCHAPQSLVVAPPIVLLGDQCQDGVWATGDVLESRVSISVVYRSVLAFLKFSVLVLIVSLLFPLQLPNAKDPRSSCVRMASASIAPKCATLSKTARTDRTSPRKSAVRGPETFSHFPAALCTELACTYVL